MKPQCPTCLRFHWEIVSSNMAALHVHMRWERFKEVCQGGDGPTPSLDGVYKFPRYHVAELDRWLRQGSRAAA